MKNVEDANNPAAAEAALAAAATSNRANAAAPNASQDWMQMMG